MKFSRKSFNKNLDGRDFVIGDLHGCLAHFKELLKKIKFDETEDRMFSVGDLVDRGPNSYECLKLIQKPWFHAIMGNHEHLMFDTIKNSRFADKHGWFDYYGDWAIPYLEKNDKDFYELVDDAEKLPVLITIDTEKLGTIGLTHAEAPKDFNGVYYDVEKLIWARDKYRWSDNMGKVPEGVSMTIHGHTPVGDKPKHHKRMNAWWIDTGCFATGFLTALQFSGSDIEDAPKVHQVYIPIH